MASWRVSTHTERAAKSTGQTPRCVPTVVDVDLVVRMDLQQLTTRRSCLDSDCAAATHVTGAEIGPRTGSSARLEFPV